MFTIIFLSVILVSVVSFVGVFFLTLSQKTLDKFLEIFIGFASGSLLAGAFLHLLPESVEQLGDKTFGLVIVSFLIFFVLEKFLYWRHCHEEHCQVHAFIYLNLVGDALHNFVDGAIIAASFLTSYSLGLTTTMAVVFHEIPQEIGDFSILIYGGFKKKKALLFNFASALTAVLGALSVYFFSKQVAGIIPFFLPLAAGGFIYTAGTDLIPELHKKSGRSISASVFQFLSLSAGIVLMAILKIVLPV